MKNTPSLSHIERRSQRNGDETDYLGHNPQSGTRRTHVKRGSRRRDRREARLALTQHESDQATDQATD